MKSMLDIPYTRLLQVPDDEREFLNLEELKPHQITELGILNQTSGAGHDNRLAHSLSNDPNLAATATTVPTAALANQENCIYRLEPTYHQHHHPFAQQTSLLSQHHHHHHHQEASQIYYDLNLQNNTE